MEGIGSLSRSDNSSASPYADPSTINPFTDEAQIALFKDSPYRAVNTFRLGYKNQSVYAVSGTSRCLFSDKYKTHKYSVGRAYSC